MPDFGPHSAFIIAAWAFGAGIILFLIVRAVLDHHRQKKLLQSLQTAREKRASIRADF
jgi:heme exporter protein CcmD